MRQCYSAACRFYPDGPIGTIRFYFVDETNPYFTHPTPFHPWSNDRDDQNVNGVGEITSIKRKWYNGADDLGRDGTHFDGTLEEFAGRGVYDPLAPPSECNGTWFSGGVQVGGGLPDNLLAGGVRFGGDIVQVTPPPPVIPTFAGGIILGGGLLVPADVYGGGLKFGGGLLLPGDLMLPAGGGLRFGGGLLMPGDVMLPAGGGLRFGGGLLLGGDPLLLAGGLRLGGGFLALTDPLVLASGLRLGGTAIEPSSSNVLAGGIKPGGSILQPSSSNVLAGGIKPGGSILQPSSSNVLAGGVKPGASILQASSSNVLAGGMKPGASILQAGSSNVLAGGVKPGASILQPSSSSNVRSGGVKVGGDHTQVTTTKLYCQSTNNDTTHDVVGETNRDLGTSVGSGTQGNLTNGTIFVETTVYDCTRAGVSGTYTAKLNVTAINSYAQARFRIQIINSSGGLAYNSAYSSTFTTTGIKTLTESITWPAGGNRIRIACEVKRVGGTGLNFGTWTVTHDANSYIECP